MSEARESRSRRVQLGLLAALLACACSWMRGFVPGWCAAQVTARAEFWTTTEPDDTRLVQAFERAHAAHPCDARVEPLPPGLGSIRNLQLVVRAASDARALGDLDALVEGTRAEFERSGGRELGSNPSRATHPLPDARTARADQLLHLGTLFLTLFAAGLFAAALWRRQTSARPWPRAVAWALVAGGAIVVLIVALPAQPTGSLEPSSSEPSTLPTGLVPALLIALPIPALILGLLVRNLLQVRRAQAWSQTQGEIVVSRVAAEHKRLPNSTTQVRNRPVVEYTYRVGEQDYRGARIGIGEPTDLEPTLARYPVGARVPVFYDPAQPSQAVLERTLPVSLGCLVTGVVVLLLGAFAFASLILWPERFQELCRPYFPAGAHPFASLVCASIGSFLLLVLFASWRRARMASRWPLARGHIVRSAVERTAQSTGRSGSSRRTPVFQAVIEYAYTVEGLEYRSQRVSFGATVAGSRSFAEARAARYPAGAEVEVRYAPADPSDAVLEPRNEFAWVGLVLAGAFLFGAWWFAHHGG